MDRPVCASLKCIYIIITEYTVFLLQLQFDLYFIFLDRNTTHKSVFQKY